MTTQVPTDVDIWLHDFLQVRSIQIQEAFNLKIERFLQGAEQLTFSLPLGDQKLPFIHEDQLIFSEGRYWIVDHFEDAHPGHRSIVCNARWIELSWRTRTGTFSQLGKTVLEMVTAILAGTTWTPGTIPSDPSLFSMEAMDATNLTLIRQVSAVTGYEVEFDTVARTVSLVSAVGENRGLGFRWGSNIKEIKRTFYPPPATRLYPFGANDLNIAAVSPSGQPYVEDYSFYIAQGMTETQARALYRKDLIWVDERYLLAVNLFDAANVRIAKLSQPRVFYAASVIDLSRVIGGGTYGFDPGDVMSVDDEVLGILEDVRVTRTVQYPNDPKRDEVELGFMSNGLLDVSSGSERTLQYDTLVPIVDQNDEPMTITSSTSNYGEINITSSGAAVIVAGSTFKGTATGTGTVTFGLYIDGTVVGATYDVEFTDGVQVEFSWPTFVSELEEGTHDIHWRAQVTSGSGTVALPAEFGRSYVLVRGAVGIAGAQTPSQFIVEVITGLELDSLADEGITILITSEDDPDIWLTVEEEIEETELEDLDDEVITIDFETVLGPMWLDSTAESYITDDEISEDVPPDSLEDDLILCFLTQNVGASAITGPAGFTRIAQSTADDGSEEIWSEIWAADDDGTMAATTLTFTASSPGDLGLLVAVIRNVEVGTVSVDDDAVNDTIDPLAIADELFGSVTTSGANRMAIAFSSCAYAHLTDPSIYQPPAGAFVHHTAASAVGNRMMVASQIGIPNATTLSGLGTIHDNDTGPHAAATIMLLLQAD